MKERTRGNIALLITAVVWGSGFVAQRLGNEILPPMAFNSIRQIMAGIVLCPVLALDLSRSGYMSASSNTESQLRYKRRKLITAGSVKGVYSDDVNYTITLTSLPTTGDVATYVPNTYYTNNFIEANLTASGVAEGGKNYYFLNPKVQEYAIITYAMWDVENQIMVAPSVSPFNGAAVLGRWDLNESGNELERLDAAAHATATANNEYEFHIIVQRANKSYSSAATTTQGVAGLKAETPTPKAGQTASAVIMAQPLDLQASSPLPTAINGVASNAQPVNVEYINLAGVRSSKPFSGVNIVVTRYTDGSTTTTKVIRK